MSLKTKQTFESYKIMEMFVGECCPIQNKENQIVTIKEQLNSLKKEYEDMKKSMDEINGMIEYSQYINNTEETAYWRRFLMKTKMESREIKEKIKKLTIASKNEREELYS